jgi:hypothetical protein
LRAKTRKGWQVSLLAAVTLASLITAGTTRAAETRKPNIVYIVGDDLGWKDVGFHGSDIIAQDPSEKSDVAVQNPAKVAELQKRANELAASMAKPMLMEAEFKAVMQRLHMPPALPGEEFEFNEEN